MGSAIEPAQPRRKSGRLPPPHRGCTSAINVDQLGHTIEGFAAGACPPAAPNRLVLQSIPESSWTRRICELASGPSGKESHLCEYRFIGETSPPPKGTPRQLAEQPWSPTKRKGHPLRATSVVPNPWGGLQPVAAHGSLVVLVVDLRGKMQHFDSVLRRHARPCLRLPRPTNSCNATLTLAF